MFVPPCSHSGEKKNPTKTHAWKLSEDTLWYYFALSVLSFLLAVFLLQWRHGNLFKSLETGDLRLCDRRGKWSHPFCHFCERTWRQQANNPICVFSPNFSSFSLFLESCVPPVALRHFGSLPLLGPVSLQLAQIKTQLALHQLNAIAGTSVTPPVIASPALTLHNLLKVTMSHPLYNPRGGPFPSGQRPVVPGQYGLGSQPRMELGAARLGLGSISGSRGIDGQPALLTGTTPVTDFPRFRSRHRPEPSGSPRGSSPSHSNAPATQKSRSPHERGYKGWSASLWQRLFRDFAIWWDELVHIPSPKQALLIKFGPSFQFFTAVPFCKFCWRIKWFGQPASARTAAFTLHLWKCQQHPSKFWTLQWGPRTSKPLSRWSADPRQPTVHFTRHPNA